MKAAYDIIALVQRTIEEARIDLGPPVATEGPIDTGITASNSSEHSGSANLDSPTLRPEGDQVKR